MNLMEIKSSLEPESIKQILSSYGVEPYREDTNCFIYPTVCHNPDHSHASNKLYYYFDSKLFVCYTECDESFNIFELIQKLELQLGNKINVFQAAEKIGFGSSVSRKKSMEEIASAQAARFIEQTLKRNPAPEIKYEEIEKGILENFSFNQSLLQPWIDEGISVAALQKFGIGYSVKDVAIAIPHRDRYGNVIGVRGRFMSEDAPNKYMPLSLNGKLLTHSLRGNLYGLYENYDNIVERGRVIVYESEKSCLKHSSIFGQENNISVATCGNKISNEQIQLLVNTGVQEVIIAFDQDFTTPFERDVLFAKYAEIGKRMSLYFTVSIIMDWDGTVGEKDSPIDRGESAFNKLYAGRTFI